MAVTKHSVDTSNVAASPLPGVADTKLAKPDDLTPATTMSASGAIIEPTVIERVDFDHPAVDNHPRKGLPAASNQIDFNDPTISGADAVADNLGLPRAGKAEPTT